MTNATEVVPLAYQPIEGCFISTANCSYMEVFFLVVEGVSVDGVGQADGVGPVDGLCGCVNDTAAYVFQSH